VAHAVVPVTHAFPAGEHDWPETHATQAPAEQTIPCPQTVPSAAFCPVSTQARPASEQMLDPPWHAAPIGTHGAPVAQARHAPTLQYMLLPQPVPSTALPAGLHVGTPVEQATVCAWQEPASLQSSPARQAMHVPSLHTWPAPQLVPSLAATVGMQVAFPDVLHVTTPVVHAAAMHGKPATQGAGPPSSTTTPPSPTGPSEGTVPSLCGEPSPPPPPVVASEPVPPSSVGPETKSPSNDVQPAVMASTVIERRGRRFMGR
jgi:hypothetical protein